MKSFNAIPWPTHALVLLIASVLPATALAVDQIDLSPATNIVALGAPVVLDVEASFDSTLVGGELRVDYDPALLQLTGVNFNESYGDDPDLRCPGDPSTHTGRACRADPAFLSFGHFDGLGDGRVTSLVFDTIAEGSTTVTLQQEGPFSDETGSLVKLGFGQSDITIVPEPTFMSGLVTGCLGLAFATRRRRPRSR